MNIALINTSYTSRVSETGHRHLGLAYLVSVARSQGHSVTLIDLQHGRATLAQTADALLRGGYGLIGMSVTQLGIPNTLEMIRMLGDLPPATHLCLGGYGATYWANDLVAANGRIDSIVRGEGETSFKTLLELIPRGEWKRTPGICYRENGGLACNPNPPLVTNIDELPLPARDAPTAIETIAASRGCFGNCSFCDIVPYYKLSPGPKVRIRSPEKVAEELLAMRAHWGRVVTFTDDDFLGIEKVERGWMNAFCDALDRGGADGLRFTFQCRTDELDEAVLARLKQAGLAIVAVGVESNSPRMLKAWRKGTTPEKNARAIETLRRLRIPCRVFLIPFDAFTTIEELTTNIRLMDEIRYMDNVYHIMQPDTYLCRLEPFPGTPLFTEYQDAGLLTKKGYSYRYEFQDPSVAELYRRLESWHNAVVRPFYKRFHGRLAQSVEIAKGLAFARHQMRITREFAAVNYEFFKAMVDLFGREQPPDERSCLDLRRRFEERAARSVREIEGLLERFKIDDAAAARREPIREEHVAG